MKERPILFSTDMVKAILDDKKTMTRRVIKHPEKYERIRECDFCCPYGKVGQRLWVRETWDSDCTCCNPKCNGVIYKAGYSGVIVPDKWRPSIFMPRWASRITLEITNIRVERLQEITEKDALAEGVDWYSIENKIEGIGRWIEGIGRCQQAFRKLWDSINTKRGYSWESNPWVWVISFRRCYHQTRSKPL